MAFHQPTHRPTQSSSIFPIPERLRIDTSPTPIDQQHLDESTEWVLFSPQAESSTIHTHTTSSQRTPRTLGASRLSDFGSLDTAARSQSLYLEGQNADDDATEHGSDRGQTLDDEDEELNSLDDGLHAFHNEVSGASAALDHSADLAGAVLPTHDGLGTFPVGNAAVQAHLWQFERWNPQRGKRHARRRSSVQRRLDLLETEEGEKERERVTRIENWRLEQSKALLEEIERETRRQRRRRDRVSANSAVENMEEERASMSVMVSDESHQDRPDEESKDEDEQGFWSRLTRRLLHDLMGLDEATLSIMFGDTLPESLKNELQRDTSTPPAPAPSSDDGWQNRLLHRIARELGVLVHHFSEHPGSFSTYLRAQQTPPYLGQRDLSRSQSLSDIRSATSGNAAGGPQAATMAGGLFTPTLHHPSTSTTGLQDSSPWGIDHLSDRSSTHGNAQQAHRRTSLPNIAEEPDPASREYWEQDLDVKMIFRFLKDRFASSSAASPTTSPLPLPLPLPTSSTPLLPTSNTTGIPTIDASATIAAITSSTTPAARAKSHPTGSGESARRAALIRSHHPLTSITGKRRHDHLLHSDTPGYHYHHGRSSLHQSTQRPATSTGPTASAADAIPLLLRRPSSSSCASQSTKKSKKHASDSSRNFWDLGGGGLGGGFGGTGSASGGLGGWGLGGGEGGVGWGY